ncbi:MAG: arylesterase [Pseudomonadales bacterium]|nr:arylesterase [Pseudomonadales bacterium]NRA17465.1 arylesterase [Oceanospirillaceae bacterium]
MKIIRLLILLVLFATQSVSAKTLLVLGDSLSAAYNMQQQQGWVALMADRIKQNYPDVAVINASISGETTSGGLTRLPELIDRHQPDYIVLELAANDGLRGTSLKIIKQNIQQLISLAKQAEAKVTLVGVRLPSNYGPRYTEKFFNIFEQLAELEQVYRVPFLMQNVALNPELMQADRLHPNAAAQTIILENVWGSIAQMLGEK